MRAFYSKGWCWYHGFLFIDFGKGIYVHGNFIILARLAII